MRDKRFKHSEVVYHCRAQAVGGERLFGSRDRAMLQKLLWQVAAFSGAEVLTYCVMSNHFHVLVRFPRIGSLSNTELMRRYRALYPKPTQGQIAVITALEKQLASGGEAAELVREKLLGRMGDVSKFMKALKQRFSIWYNRKNERFGTLWAERYKSVLVEGRGLALKATAAYIDLNPVRAGLVADPEDYRFCGYAEAATGAAEALCGLRRIWPNSKSGAAALREHRTLLFGKGADSAKSKCLDRQGAIEVLEAGGVLPMCDLLRCRVRYFTDGAVLGSPEFVRAFSQHRQEGRVREVPETGYPLKGADWDGLVVMNPLRRKIFH